jgi:hypothetical protein
MPVQDLMRAAAQERAETGLARLNSTPTPRMLSPQIAEALSKSSHATARLKFELGWLDELEAQATMIDDRLFRLNEVQQRLLIDQGAHEYAAKIAAPELSRERVTLFKNSKPGDMVERVGPDAAEARRIESELREVNEAVTSLRARQAAIATLARPLSARIAQCKRFIAGSVHGGALKFIPAPTITDKLTLGAARGKILNLAADAKMIEAAPLPAAAVKLEITSWVEGLAVAPNIDPLFDRGAIYLEQTVLRSMGGTDGLSMSAVDAPNAIGVLFWALKDQIIAKLHADADALADGDKNALDDVARAKKLADIKKETLETERIEEALCWAALQNGESMELRGDSDVRAILSIG